MDYPQPPLEVRNVIDKLAQFVARNGAEFESMTKQKQRDNPTFEFLFGGPYFNYYQYRVTTEQAVLRQRGPQQFEHRQPQQQQPHPHQPPLQHPPPQFHQQQVQQQPGPPMYRPPMPNMGGNDGRQMMGHPRHPMGPFIQGMTGPGGGPLPFPPHMGHHPQGGPDQIQHHHGLRPMMHQPPLVPISQQPPFIAPNSHPFNQGGPPIQRHVLPGSHGFDGPRPHHPMSPQAAPPPIHIRDAPPDVPYFELPAGLMVPMVKLSESGYKPLQPKNIRLPPPTPQNERLLKAMEAFYAPPSHERPRNSEGWEKLGLYEFYKDKAQVMKDEKRHSSDSDDSRSPRRSRDRSPAKNKKSASPHSPKRRYKEDRSPQKSRRRSTSSSSSRSSTPPRRRRSRSRSRSPKPRTQTKKPPPRAKSRSLSPDSYAPSFAAKKKLDSSNKGHQLLSKMGWSGSGLGASEQGIQEPVSSGDVRDKQDAFKGVGVELGASDPYEQFRRNRGQQFMNRIVAAKGDPPVKKTT